MATTPSSTLSPHWTSTKISYSPHIHNTPIYVLVTVPYIFVPFLFLLIFVFCFCFLLLFCFFFYISTTHHRIHRSITRKKTRNHLPDCPRRRGTQGRDTTNTVDEPLRFGGGGVLSSHIFLYIFYITHLSSTNPYFSP